MPALPPTEPASFTADTRILESRQPAPEPFAHASASRQLIPASDASIILPRSIDGAPAHHQLQERQQAGIVAIPTVYQGINAGPAPGAVVGIVLGSVLGFLFLMWLFWTLSNGGGFIKASQDTEEEVIRTRRSRSPRSRRSHARTEMTSRTSPRTEQRDRVYRTERIVRDYPPAPASRSRERSVVRERDTVLVEESQPRPSERRVDGDDIVEVIEEHSSVSGAPPPRRKGGRRGSQGYRSVVTNEEPLAPPMPPGGYRPIDPDSFAGGGYVQRPVRY